MATSAVTPPQTLPADFDGWDKPTAPPKTLPANFQGWDDTLPPAHQEALGLLGKIQQSFDQSTNLDPEEAKHHSAAMNTAARFVGGALQGAVGPIVHPVQALEGVGNMIAHPIDSVTNMAISAYHNPAQTAGQLAGGAILGEGAGAAADALNGGVSGLAGRAALLGKTPQEAYESALKPSTTLPAAMRANVVQTGLEHGIPVSLKGVQDIGDKIDKLNEDIKSQIASDPNRPIDPNAVATRADLAKAKFSKQVNAQSDLDAIEASKQQFLKEQGATANQPAPPMGAADAQAMKQGTYRVLAGKYGEQGSASVEAQKALARGLKEEIATQFPEITKLNSDESKLLDLQPLLERAVARQSNHQLIGIGTPIAGSAVKAVTGSGSAGAVAAALKAVLDNPMVKSRLAIAVSRGAKIPYAAGLAKVGAYSSSLGNFLNAPDLTPTSPAPTP